ncbi:uncharacterized protein MKK02DRAFT_37555 [Dioszegia hungarica]|uniref:TPR-like protein n=1 Tax=Dioszegia hungarica TaxID=4972 RepID=A0AA38LTF2_9TREE|nr:uncharacterized protein MKK02DRAFT_37555 [Dioszegia hungarica]KAI9634678.1 hypothetical protein MKK02DRAFT_37555 [Dioszegia hungarica]
MSRHVAKLARLTANTARPLALRIPLRAAAIAGASSGRSSLHLSAQIQRTSIRFASSDATAGSTTDPSLVRGDELMQRAGAALEEGDVETARGLYEECVGVCEGANAWFNLGVCEYHLMATYWAQDEQDPGSDAAENTPAAIKAWEKSLEHVPSSDAHTNLASAHILSKPPQPALAVKHLTAALELSPDDPEIAFNLAAVLESTGSLEHALKLYKRAEDGGISRAKQNIISISAKIMGQKSAAALASSSGTSP